MKTKSKIVKGLVYLFTGITFFSLFFIIAFILIKGVPHLNLGLFQWKYTSENLSMMPAIINTLIMIVLALIISVPLGILTAVYLSEYANQKSKIVNLVRITADTLSGIPSIVYGLFGMLFFVIYLKWNMSILAGSMTVAIMILPLIMRSTEEALLAVPQPLRDASFGLGAGRVRTILKIVIPSAMPGILAGVILGIGRIIGETAALLYTSGTVAEVPSRIVGEASGGRTLALHMYALSSEGLNVNQAYATGVVLLIVILAINFISTKLAKKLGKDTIDE
ncbi:phosphate ABC transporter permease PstA [Miniphocaeibacter halophilus]|uniref:Phosphate ABC transporter permease PstA n=1 Tax=Miniphocaeibacter halophilus TaxID=2931922 RepID=A0AC61N0M0_9FIRM|nr:phosphate ABC transporter permease PstA [Miniphocaeibacter halophilus]QQK08546.1 phosphate ABC transporter permease PstA [Miniphocaeibacter halophilus]